mgnify:CR=1 FL=1
MTANAHCGSCGTGEAHAKAAAKTEACEMSKKSDCGDKSACADKKDCGDKTGCADKAACGDKKECGDKAACADKKDCADKASCGDKKDCADASKCDGSESKPKELPMPKMACCAGK